MKSPMRLMAEAIQKMLEDTGGAPNYQDIEDMLMLASDLEEAERQVIMASYMDGIYDYSTAEYNLKHPTIYYQDKFKDNFDNIE